MATFSDSDDAGIAAQLRMLRQGPAAELVGRPHLLRSSARFAADCAEGVLGGRCPNCGGELVRRPIRPRGPAAAPPGRDAPHLQTARMRPGHDVLRASRRGLVPPFIAMDVLRAANEREAAGADVIHLEVGQPGTPAPEPVLEAARRALADERIGYTDALGIAPLRQAIAGHYRAQYGVAVDPAEVVVTTGSSAAFQLAFLAAFEPGDRVGARCSRLPGLSQYPDGARHRAGADHGRRERPLPADTRVDRRGSGPLDGLIIASPANPTGTMIGAAELARLVELLPRSRHPPDLGRDLPRHHL